MAEEPRPLMYEVGVEGNYFNPHRKNAECAVSGCVPVTPQYDDGRDAARWRWLVAHLCQESVTRWRLPEPVAGQPIPASFTALLDELMAHQDGAIAQTLQQELSR